MLWDPGGRRGKNLEKRRGDESARPQKKVLPKNQELREILNVENRERKRRFKQKRLDPYGGSCREKVARHNENITRRVRCLSNVQEHGAGGKARSSLEVVLS